MYFTYEEIDYLYACISLQMATYKNSNKDKEYRDLEIIHEKFQTIFIRLQKNKCRIECLQKNCYIPTIYDKLNNLSEDDMIDEINDKIKDLDL